MKTRILIPLLLVFCTLLAGCMKWKSPVVSDTEIDVATTVSTDEIDALFDEAKTHENRAIDKRSLKKSIAEYEKILVNSPNHLETLLSLGHLYLLLGDGYESDDGTQKSNFFKAIQYNERAMLNNSNFRRRVNNGERLWEAVDALDESNMDAMHFWVTGIFYVYKECLGTFGQITNFKWIKRAKMVMDRMTQIDPNWGNGMLHFDLACYYLSIPEIAGGDRQKAEEYFAKSFSQGTDRIFSRWGRAKYFHFKMNNMDEFKNDLEWVVNQDIADYADPFPWKIYFQKDAEYMLQHSDELFAKGRKQK